MKLHVGGKLTAKGFEIILNRKSFPISYPSEIWKKYPSILKNILLDNVAYSSTLFLPQMHDQKTITYTTNRPLSETFLYEYEHKKKLMKKFEKEFNVKIYVVNYGPGIFRYGKYWNLQTELGWGLHTTDYVIMSLPFAHYFNASLIILGNEVSCNDFFFNKDGVLTYDAGYDQHKDWTPQQSLLGSLLLGREIDVASFVDGR